MLTQRSWMSRIGTGLRKWSFSRPRRLVTTSPASSSTLRCFMTPKRVMENRSSSMPRVCPSSRNNSSSRSRRVGSARALNTSSTPALYVTFWSHVKVVVRPPTGSDSLPAGLEDLPRARDSLELGLSPLRRSSRSAPAQPSARPPTPGPGPLRPARRAAGRSARPVPTRRPCPWGTPRPTWTPARRAQFQAAHGDHARPGTRGWPAVGFVECHQEAVSRCSSGPHDHRGRRPGAAPERCARRSARSRPRRPAHAARGWSRRCR